MWGEEKLQDERADNEERAESKGSAPGGRPSL